MGHVVFADPGIRRFHLHERLARELRSRGHRVSVLCVDPVAATFWSCQDLGVTRVQPVRPTATQVPVERFAALDCRLRDTRPAGRALGRATARLQRLLPGIQRFFEVETPALVFLHRERSGTHGLLDLVARESGSRVLWTGDGLLPHTLQLDEHGIDGDSTTAQRSAWDFRGQHANQPFLASALAALLGRTTPLPLARRLLQEPPLRARLRDAFAGLLRQHRHGIIGPLRAWRRAAGPGAEAAHRFELPNRPFVAVLLQHRDDVRVRLDSDAAPSPRQLLRAVRRAADALGPDVAVVAVLPPGGLPAHCMAQLRGMPGLQIEFAQAAPDAAAAALAVITINHPLGVVAPLVGTPVLHLGRALYGLPGAAWRATTDTLADDLAAAFGDDHPELRKSFLTWLLMQGHVWCGADHPDHNGLAGLVLEIEARLQERSPNGGRLRYRAGPAWPLAVEGRGA
jgi:hypothetical protein